MVKTAVLVSGGGMNLQSLINARMFGEIPNCELAAVISSNPEAYALKRAELAGIRRYIVDRAMFPNDAVFCSAVLDKLRDLDIELVVLAGFDFSIPSAAFKHFNGKIINTYPSLMPAFTGEGLSGEAIHAAALDAGVRLTGATAYFAAEQANEGLIILQKAVTVRACDTAASLQRRVLEEGENYVLPRAVALFCDGRLKIEDGAVRILEKGANP